MLLYLHYLSCSDQSGSVGRNYNINVLNEVLVILHCITAKPAFIFGLEVWFVSGKNYKEFVTHEITFRRLIAGYTRTLKGSYSHSTVANVVKNFMIHRTQRRAHVERM